MKSCQSYRQLVPRLCLGTRCLQALPARDGYQSAAGYRAVAGVLDAALAMLSVLTSMWCRRSLRAVRTQAEPGYEGYYAMRLFILALLTTCAADVNARTIELTDYDCDRMAAISPQAPRSGWAMTEIATGEFSTALLDLRAERAFLVRYPLGRIPQGQRIARAEWILPVGLISATSEPKLHVRRILGEWGAGVSYDHRALRPKAIRWTQPGAGGVSTDRAAQPSAVVAVPGMGELTINVTEDVELWYTGVAENQGWIVTVEDPAALVRLNSPFWTGHGAFKLRITYEPE